MGKEKKPKQEQKPPPPMVEGTERQKIALTKLVKKNWDSWVRCAVALGLDWNDAEDVVQELLTIFISRGPDDPIRNPLGYAKRKIPWLVKDFRQQRSLASIDALLQGDTPQFADPKINTPDVILEYAEEVRLVAHNVSQLSEADQIILWLRFECDWIFREIGEQLGITENTASVQSRRAVDRLAQRLGISQPENEDPYGEPPAEITDGTIDLPPSHEQG